MQQIVIFLRALTGPAWFCMLVATAGFFVSIYAWLPLAHSSRLALYLVAAAMAAGLIAFMSMAGHHIITWQHRKAPQPRIRLPRIFWVSAIGSLGYFFAVFLGTAIVYPQGVDLGPSVNLRIASAAAQFFGVATLGFTQWAGLRVRALQSAP